jgi:hypothetical protein
MSKSFRWRSIEERPLLDCQTVFRNNVGDSLLVLLGSNGIEVGIVLWNDRLKSFSSDYQSLRQIAYWMYPTSVFSLCDISQIFGIKHIPSVLDKICSDCSKQISAPTPIPFQEVAMMERGETMQIPPGIHR